MASRNILVIEDDRHIAKLIKYNLDKAGFDCTVTKTGEEAFALLDRERVDLILLDIMLPGMDGWEVCRRIRQSGKIKSVPIIMLTAKGEETDRVVGFELGADDYVVKPFSVRELVLRIKAVLKRGEHEDEKADKLRTGDIAIDIARHKVTAGKKDVVLTNMEFNLLVTLLSRQGRVQSREALLESVWDISSDVTTRTVDTHVKRLREKLGRSGKSIETVRGVGYRFKEED